jgi:hypothetical protein
VGKSDWWHTHGIRHVMEPAEGIGHNDPKKLNSPIVSSTLSTNHVHINAS